MIRRTRAGDSSISPGMRREAAICWVLALVTVGCSPAGPLVNRHSILFDAAGWDIDGPTWNMELWLSTATRQERARLISDLLDIIETSWSYPRYVAAKALLGYFDGPGAEFITDRAVRVLGSHCLRVAKMEDIVIAEWIREAPAWYDMPVDAAFEVPCDGMNLRLCRHPWRIYEGWQIVNVRISLDGEEVRSQPGPLGPPYLVHVRLLKALGDRPLLGEHSWQVEFDLVAPNGTSAHISREWPFSVCREIEMKTD